MNFKPKMMMVTGGAGFIGSNFVRYMLKTDSTLHIVNLDKLTYAGSLDNLKELPDDSRHFFNLGDICDQKLVRGLLREYEIDTIVNFAAESHVDRSITEPGNFIQTNIVGTFTLLEEVRQYWLEENKWNDPPFTEETPYAPNSPYSASKAASDHLVRSYYHTYKLPVTTTNCSNNYGPYQNKEKFVPTIIRHCLEYKNIPVYGDGSNIRDWLFVEDHCCGIDMVIRKGEFGEVYNLGGDNEWVNIELVRFICKIMDEININHVPHEKLISFIEDRPGHDWRYAINATKVKKKLGWEQKISCETAMKLTVEWMISNSIK